MDKAPPLRGTAEGSELRTFALEFGIGLLREQRIRGLRPVFTLVTFLNPQIEQPPGRAFADGKKIGWRDAVAALLAIVRYRFFD